MLKKYSDIISGAILLLFSAAMYYATTKIKVFAAMEGLSSRFFPRIVIAGLVLLGAIVFYRGIQIARTYVVEASEGMGIHGNKLSVGTLCSIETILAIFIYVGLLEPVGFLITTTFYLVAQMLILAPERARKKDYILYVSISLICSLGIYYLFAKAVVCRILKRKWRTL